MTTKKLDHGRRTLLQYTAWGLGLTTLGVPVIAHAASPGTASDPVDVDALLTSMKAIGQEYLAQVPGENSRRTLLELVETRTGPNGGDGPQGFSWEGIRASIKDDFENDNVVFLNGWTFARTEARLYALAVV